MTIYKTRKYQLYLPTPGSLAGVSSHALPEAYNEYRYAIEGAGLADQTSLRFAFH
jgi:hypothetical protein